MIDKIVQEVASIDRYTSKRLFTVAERGHAKLEAILLVGSITYLYHSECRALPKGSSQYKRPQRGQRLTSGLSQQAYKAAERARDSYESHLRSSQTKLKTATSASRVLETLRHFCLDQISRLDSGPGIRQLEVLAKIREQAESLTIITQSDLNTAIARKYAETQRHIEHYKSSRSRLKRSLRSIEATKETAEQHRQNEHIVLQAVPEQKLKDQELLKTVSSR